MSSPAIFNFQKSFWCSTKGETQPSDQLKEQRKSLGILIKGDRLDLCPPPITTLEIEMFPSILEPFIKNLDIKQPSTIQMQAWPAIMSGADVLGIAPTGSGKTLAYVLPFIPHILDQIQNNKTKANIKPPKISSLTRYPTVLILVPTRELCIQVESTLKLLKKCYQLQSCCIYGGQDKDIQLSKYKQNGGSHILVCTPGRLVDFIQEKQIHLSHITYVVLDEADRMLSLGFEEQLQTILSYIRTDRQTVLFSASFPGKLREKVKTWMKNDVVIRCNTIEITSSSSSSFSNNDKNTNHNNSNTTTTTTNTSKEAILSTSSSLSESLSSSLPQSKKHDLLVNDSGNNKNNKKQKRDDILDKDNNDNNSNNNHDNNLNDADDYEDQEEESSSSSNNNNDMLQVTNKASNNFQSSVAISTSIIQHVHVCASHKKPRLLIHYLEQVRQQEKISKTRQQQAMLIFCTKIKTVKFVLDFLYRHEHKLGVDMLHGTMQQSQREKILNEFRAGKINTLVSTDVCARGIHIKRLKYVVNYDFPSTLEQYCHRIGRVGRQGAIGESYSLITRNMAPIVPSLVQLLQTYNQKVEPNLLSLASDVALLSEINKEEDDDKGEESGKNESYEQDMSGNESYEQDNSDDQEDDDKDDDDDDDDDH